MKPPVIAIDGPSASGKGTVAAAVAKRLGFHYLDSGALYRATALAAMARGLDLADESVVAALARHLDLKFVNGNIELDGVNADVQLRSEECGKAASVVAALPQVREALLDLQRNRRRPPGLVADGRDMGSVVFPDAILKIYLTASARVRAERRHKQLIDKGNHASIASLLQDIEARDARDQARSVAPLIQGSDAICLDTSDLTVEQAVAEVLTRFGAITSSRSG